MKMKDMILIAMGGVMGMAFMKYKKPIQDAMKKAMAKEKAMIDSALEDMM